MVLARAYICACALTALAHAMTSHGDDDTWWYVDVPVGSDFTLNGTEDQVPFSAQWQTMMWILPDMHNMSRGSYMEFPTSDGTVVMNVSKDGVLLHVKNLQKDYFGLYYCMIVDNNITFHVTRRGVNMEYYFAEDIIERYERYLVITGITAGMLAAVAIFVLILTFWSNRSSRNDNPEPDETAEIVKKEQAPPFYNPDVKARGAKVQAEADITCSPTDVGNIVS